MQLRSIVFGIIIGLIAALPFLNRGSNSQSVSPTNLNNQASIAVRSADNVSPLDQQPTGVDILGSAKIGPKQGDTGQTLQTPSSGIDKIVGDVQISTKH